MGSGKNAMICCMCGRINVSDNEGLRVLLAMLGMDVWPSRDPRYNVAPTSVLDVILPEGQHARMRWGLTPSWARAGKPASPLINARAETIHEKRSFKHLVAERRVVIPINGFYEWQRKEKSKQAFHIHSSRDAGLLLAAIWQPAANDTSTSASPTESDSAHKTALNECCIVTTAANRTMATIHHRMPVLLDAAGTAAWLSDTHESDLDALMQPTPDNWLSTDPVSSYVNNARNEGPQCLEPPES